MIEVTKKVKTKTIVESEEFEATLTNKENELPSFDYEMAKQLMPITDNVRFTSCTATVCCFDSSDKEAFYKVLNKIRLQ